jgi:hypothetical protein
MAMFPIGNENSYDPSKNVAAIRGEIREVFGFKGGPKHREDYCYGQ